MKGPTGGTGYLSGHQSLSWLTPFIQQLSSSGAEEPQVRAAEEQVLTQYDDLDWLHGRRAHVAHHPRGGDT